MQFRKIAAVAGSALMAGMTLAGAAMAATTVGTITSDLGKAGAFPLFVVGKSASAEDVAGAIDIAVRLAANHKTTTTTGVTTTVTGVDGATYHLETEIANGLRDSVENVQKGLTPASVVLIPTGKTGGTEATFLKSGKITISGTDYEWKEIVNVTASTAVDAAWDTSATESKDNYKATVVTIPAADSNLNTGIVYTVSLDKNMTEENIEGKDIYFLGKKYVVQDAKLTTSPKELHLAEAGAETSVAPGDKVTVGTHSVEVSNIDTMNKRVTVKVTDAAGISVSGTIDAGSSDTINGVNIAVKKDSVGEGYTASGKTAMATLLMSESDVLVKLKDGQKYDGDWYAYIKTTGSPAALTSFGLYYTKARTGTDSLKSGDSISAPGNAFVVKYDGVEETSKTGTVTISVEPGQYIDSDMDGTSDVYGLKLSADSKIFSVSGSLSGAAEVDTVYLKPASSGTGDTNEDISAETWFFVNTTSGYESLSSAPTVVYTEKTFGGLNYVVPVGAFGVTNGTANENSGYLVITEPTTANSKQGSFLIEYNATPLRKFNSTVSLLGTADNDPLAYVDYNLTAVSGIAGKSGVWLARSGTNAYVRTGFSSPYGSKLVSAGESLVKIEIPKSQRAVRLIIGKEGAAITTGGAEAVTVVPITADIARLDTEITDADKSANDLIVVGGPCVNRIAAELLGKTFPACGAESGIPENAALVQVFQDKYATGKVAVLVAGWEAANTKKASTMLQSDALKDRTESAVKISDSTVTALTVS